jgi:hypothetical protein
MTNFEKKVEKRFLDQIKTFFRKTETWFEDKKRKFVFPAWPSAIKLFCDTNLLLWLTH